MINRVVVMFVVLLGKSAQVLAIVNESGQGKIWPGSTGKSCEEFPGCLCSKLDYHLTRRNYGEERERL